MNNYEAVFILNPKLADEELAAIKTDLRARLDGVAARDIAEIKCERRMMSFPIKKSNEGLYLIYRFRGPNDAVARLRTELKHMEQCLRMSFLRVPESPLPAAPATPAPTAEPEVATESYPASPEAPAASISEPPAVENPPI